MSPDVLESGDPARNTDGNFSIFDVGGIADAAVIGAAGGDSDPDPDADRVSVLNEGTDMDSGSDSVFADADDYDPDPDPDLIGAVGGDTEAEPDPVLADGVGNPGLPRAEPVVYPELPLIAELAPPAPVLRRSLRTRRSPERYRPPTR